MRLRPLSACLENFDVGEEIFPPILAPEVAIQPESRSTTSSLEIDERERAVTAALEEAKLQFLAQRETDLLEFSTRVAAERHAWCQSVGLEMSQLISNSLASATRELKESIEQALLPFVNRRALDMLLNDFLVTLKHAVSSENHLSIRIQAPPDLKTVLHGFLAQEGIVAEIVESERMDISVTLGATTIVSRLNDWLTSLSDERLSDE